MDFFFCRDHKLLLAAQVEQDQVDGVLQSGVVGSFHAVGSMYARTDQRALDIVAAMQGGADI